MSDQLSKLGLRILDLVQERDQLKAENERLWVELDDHGRWDDKQVVIIQKLGKQLDEARELLNNARNKINYMRQNGEWYYPERLLDRIDAWLEANK